MISDLFEILLLSLIQGVSEFLPISSAAHLILASNIYEFKNQSLLIDISLHLGSLLAILFYFRNEIFNLKNNLNLFYKIIVATLPLIITGYLLYSTEIIYEFRNIKVIVWTTFAGAILLHIADRRKIFNNLENSFNFKSALIIGLFQIIALIPGTSRAGITITAGRILGFNRTDSTKISFYLSIPALAGASAVGIKDLLKEDGMTINGVKKYLAKSNSFKLDESNLNTIKASKNNIKNKVEKISTIIKQIKELG